MLICDHSLIRGLYDNPTQWLWDPLGNPVMGCFMFIVLPQTFQHVCFVFPERNPHEEGPKSAFVLILSQLQILKKKNITSYMFWLHIEIDSESKVSICKHFNSIFCIKHIKHLHIQGYLVFVEGFY